MPGVGGGQVEAAVSHSGFAPPSPPVQSLLHSSASPQFQIPDAIYPTLSSSSVPAADLVFIGTLSRHCLSPTLLQSVSSWLVSPLHLWTPGSLSGTVFLLIYRQCHSHLLRGSGSKRNWVTPETLGCMIKGILFRKRGGMVLPMALPGHPGVVFKSGVLLSVLRELSDLPLEHGSQVCNDSFIYMIICSCLTSSPDCMLPEARGLTNRFSSSLIFTAATV